MLWTLSTQLKTGADDVKTVMYMILMFMERWGPAAGCGGCSLVDSGRTQEVEEIEVGRRFHSETVRVKKA